MESKRTEKEQVGVAGIVFTHNRQNVLLIQRRDIPVWALPGGGVDPAESPEQTVVREIQEETGVVTQIVRLVALYTPINRLASTTFVFECELLSGEPCGSAETRAAAFFPIEELPKTLFFIHHDWIKEALKNHPRPLFAPLTQVTYWNLFKYFLRHPIQVFRMALAKCGIPYNT